MAEQLGTNEHPPTTYDRVGSPGTEITDSCEPPCECWELKPGPLEERSVLLTAEPSLQPPDHEFLNSNVLILLIVPCP